MLFPGVGLLVIARLCATRMLQPAREIGVIDWSRRLNVNPCFYWDSSASSIATVANHLACATTSAAPYIIV